MVVQVLGAAAGGAARGLAAGAKAVGQGAATVGRGAANAAQSVGRGAADATGRVGQGLARVPGNISNNLGSRLGDTPGGSRLLPRIGGRATPKLENVLRPSNLGKMINAKTPGPNPFASNFIGSSNLGNFSPAKRSQLAASGPANLGAGSLASDLQQGAGKKPTIGDLPASFRSSNIGNKIRGNEALDKTIGAIKQVNIPELVDDAKKALDGIDPEILDDAGEFSRDAVNKLKSNLGPGNAVSSINDIKKYAKDLSQRIKSAKFKHFYPALALAIFKDCLDIIDLSQIVSMVLNVVLAILLFFIFVSQGIGFRKWFARKMLTKVILWVLIEFVPFLSIIPVYTVGIIILKLQIDSYIGSNTRAYNALKKVAKSLPTIY